MHELVKNHPVAVMVAFFVLMSGSFIAVSRYMAQALSNRPFKETERRLTIVEQSLRMYRFDFDQYPGEEEGLGALIFNPKTGKPWPHPYLVDIEMGNDEWGVPFDYAVIAPDGDQPDLVIELRSSGPDRQMETSDDVVWQVR